MLYLIFMKLPHSIRAGPSLLLKIFIQRTMRMWSQTHQYWSYSLGTRSPKAVRKRETAVALGTLT